MSEIDRGARNLFRARRAFQALGEGLSISFAPPLSFGVNDSVSLSLSSPNPGLQIVGSGLGVLINPTFSGLAVTGTGITVVVDTNKGLSIPSSGIAISLASNSGLEFSAGLRLMSSLISVSGASQLAFFGSVPITRPGEYTIISAPVAGLALDADANSGAYTGIDNVQLGTVYAQVSSLNDLRSDVESLASVLRKLVGHLGDSGLGLLSETGY